MTDQAVTTSTAELLNAVEHLSDDELLLLNKLALRLANEFTEELVRPRVVEVIRRCGVVLAEEQDRRRDLVEYTGQQLADGGKTGCPLSDWYDREHFDDPCTD